MSPRSLFNVVLKILGLLLLKEILVTIPSLFAMFIYLGADRSSGFGSLALIALSCLLYGWLSWQLIVRTDNVIDFFKLDKNFPEEHLTIGLHRSSVLVIAVIIIGGLVLIDAIPDVCRQVVNYWEQRRLFADMENSKTSIVGIVVPAVKLLTGLLLLGYTRAIVNFIELKRKP